VEMKKREKMEEAKDINDTNATVADEHFRIPNSKTAKK
jgi:hypothetical protein